MLRRVTTDRRQQNFCHVGKALFEWNAKVGKRDRTSKQKDGIMNYGEGSGVEKEENDGNCSLLCSNHDQQEALRLEEELLPQSANDEKP
jgi:hypothetical protein